MPQFHSDTFLRDWSDRNNILDASVDICHSGAGKGGERCRRSSHSRRDRTCGPIASYLRAVNTGANEEFPANFADDAVVVDVSRELRGLDAITSLGHRRHLRGSRALRRPGRHKARRGQTIVTVKIDGTLNGPDTRSSCDEPRVHGRRGEDHRTANRVLEDTLIAVALVPTGDGPAPYEHSLRLRRAEP